MSALAITVASTLFVAMLFLFNIMMLAATRSFIWVICTISTGILLVVELVLLSTVLP